MAIRMVAIIAREGAWRDLEDKEVIHLANEAPPIQVAPLRGGMASGRTSVAIRVDLPNGRAVVAETSLRLFLQTADVLRARYGAD